MQLDTETCFFFFFFSFNYYILWSIFTVITPDALCKGEKKSLPQRNAHCAAHGEVFKAAGKSAKKRRSLNQICSEKDSSESTGLIGVISAEHKAAGQVDGVTLTGAGWV